MMKYNTRITLSITDFVLNCCLTVLPWSWMMVSASLVDVLRIYVKCHKCSNCTAVHWEVVVIDSIAFSGFSRSL